MNFHQIIVTSSACMPLSRNTKNKFSINIFPRFFIGKGFAFLLFEKRLSWIIFLCCMLERKLNWIDEKLNAKWDYLPVNGGDFWNYNAKFMCILKQWWVRFVWRSGEGMQFSGLFMDWSSWGKLCSFMFLWWRLSLMPLWWVCIVL
jgi:hypothetical protein